LNLIFKKTINIKLCYCLIPNRATTGTPQDPPSGPAPDLRMTILDDFRGLNLTVPLRELTLKTKFNLPPPEEPKDQLPQTTPDKDLLRTFKLGDQKVHLRDFRGLATSKLDLDWNVDEEELGEDDLGTGWRINPLNSFLTEVDQIEEEVDTVDEIPQLPARQALSRAAAASFKDGMDPIIRHLEISANQEPHETDTTPVLYRCPSLISALKPPKAEVFIYLFPEHRMISRECRLDVTIYQIKEAISRYIRVSPTQLELKRHKHVCHDERNLLELGAKPNSRVLFQVDVNKRLAFAENRNALQRMEDYKPKVLDPRPDTIRRVTCMVKGLFSYDD